jgi:hypothetical protein
MPYAPNEWLKGKFYWPVDHYSVPADNLCWHVMDGSFDCPCTKPRGHPGKHQYTFDADIRDYSHKDVPFIKAGS